MSRYVSVWSTVQWPRDFSWKVQPIRSEPVSELGRCLVVLVTGRAGALVVIGGGAGAEDELSVRGNWGCRGEKLCVAESELRKVWIESTQSESWVRSSGE